MARDLRIAIDPRIPPCPRGHGPIEANDLPAHAEGVQNALRARAGTAPLKHVWHGF